MPIETLDSAQKILIVGHVRPDGDCLGAGLALKLLAAKFDRTADFLCDSALPEHYRFLPGFDTVNVKTCDDYDLLVTVDCADESRLGCYGELLRRVESVNIDHHITNTGFGSINIVKEYSSTCEILSELLSARGQLDQTMASLLYVGMSTDTGHFAHNNTNARVLRNAAMLLDFGFDAYQIVKNLYRSNSLAKTKLIGTAIESMRFFAQNKICIISIFQRDLVRCGCTLADTEGLIDYAVAIKDVDVAICLSQQAGNKYKVSFRSKSCDISKAAAAFGGGGHKQAAGCNAMGRFDYVIGKLLRAVEAATGYTR